MAAPPFPPALVPAVLLALSLAIFVHVLLSRGGKRRRVAALTPGEKVCAPCPPPS